MGWDAFPTPVSLAAAQHRGDRPQSNYGCPARAAENLNRVNRNTYCMVATTRTGRNEGGNRKVGDSLCRFCLTPAMQQSSHLENNSVELKINELNHPKISPKLNSKPLKSTAEVLDRSRSLHPRGDSRYRETIQIALN